MAPPTCPNHGATPDDLSWAEVEGVQLSAISLHVDGSSVITGFMRGDSSFGTLRLTSPWAAASPFVARVSRTGNTSWAVRYGGTVSARGNGITAHADGSTVAVGYFGGNATFGGAATLKAPTSGRTVAYVAKLSASGDTAWAVALGGGGANAQALAVAAVGGGTDRMDSSSVVTGYFGAGSGSSATSGAFGAAGTLKTQGSRDVFVAKVDTAGEVRQALCSISITRSRPRSSLLNSLPTIGDLGRPLWREQPGLRLWHRCTRGRVFCGHREFPGHGLLRRGGKPHLGG